MSDRTQAEVANPRRMAWTEFVKFGIAVIVLAGFSWIVIYLMGKTHSASEREWTRAVYLLSGVEAIAFAAAGFIFGREVNRKRAQKAEERASEAESQKAESLKRAIAFETKGQALATAIRARSAVTSKSPTTRRNLGGGADEMGSQADIDHLKKMADALFPPIQHRPENEVNFSK